MCMACGFCVAISRGGKEKHDGARGDSAVPQDKSSREQFALNAWDQHQIEAYDVKHFLDVGVLKWWLLNRG